jgi:site-specific DNA-methyltransferase (adenine-specific)
MVCAIEDAGFEIRDQIMWLYGSGFPKSHDVSKAIDREAGLLPPESTAFTVAGYSHKPDKLQHTAPSRGYVPPAPATDDARTWSGWGTALKPAHEPIVVARKPFKGTVAQNVLEHGTGALNIEGCRVGTEGGTRKEGDQKFGWDGSRSGARVMITKTDGGRWPANVIHDGSHEITSGLGQAARFFYCAKASKRDREEGLQPGDRRANIHPTVKPTDLMRYLCRLVTPPGGLVLDPFTGSGSTGKAAVLEGFRFIGCELSEEYAAIARARIAAASTEAP